MSDTHYTLISGAQMLNPGICRGIFKRVRTLADAQSVTGDSVVVSLGLPPFLSPYCWRAQGFVVGGSEADHTVAYIRELWKPAISVATDHGLIEGERVTLDATKGMIYQGWLDLKTEPAPRLEFRPQTQVYLFLGIPRMASRAAELDADGVGLLRTNLIIQELGEHPMSLVRSRREILERTLVEGITTIATAFTGKPVWVRTMDFATSDLRHFPGGKDEPLEANPMLGWRGIIRELDQEELLRTEFRALRRVLDGGIKNIGVLFPLVRDIEEYCSAKAIMKDCGLTPHTDISVGCMFETPSSALQICQFISAGLDLAFVGVNDLTQYTLAADRSNPMMARIYNPANSAMLDLIRTVLSACREHSVNTTMSVQTPLLPFLGGFAETGLRSVSVTADMINVVAEQLVEDGH